jgi:enoyl-CoA hydratase/carnithine racemase
MNMIDLSHEDAVAVIKLNHGITNAINQRCVAELSEVLQSLKSDPKVDGLVLSSTNDKFFSIGFDIPELYELSKEDFRLFYQSFNQVCMDLYTIPKPTIAAITGHAIAGGTILSLCCDYRFIADERKLMGLNEIKLGVPVPYLTDCILQSLVGTRVARDIIDSGEFFEPEKLIQMGMVDQKLPLEDVLERSIEKVRLICSMSKEAFETIKQNRVEMIEARVLAQWETKQGIFIELWYSEKSRKRLKEAMEKF